MKKIISFIISMLLLITVVIGLYFLYLLTTDGNEVGILQVINPEEGGLGVSNSNEQSYQGQSVSGLDSALSSGQEGEQIKQLENRYFYNQLDEYAKIIYSGLDQNVENLKTGNYTIDFKKSFNQLLNSENGNDILNKSYQSALDAFVMDRVDVFYLDISKMYMNIKSISIGPSTTYEVYINTGNHPNYYSGTFTSKAEVDQAIAQVENVRSQIYNSINGNTYQKIMGMHDWLVEQIEYDTTLNRPNKDDIYGALIQKNVVCGGYARAFKYLLDGMEIPCVLVVGTGTNSEGKQESHAWNYVSFDQNWYAVDTTWDDPIIIGNGKTNHTIKYQYFMKGQNSFNKVHTSNGNISGSGMVFTYPTLSMKDYEI